MSTRREFLALLAAAAVPLPPLDGARGRRVEQLQRRGPGLRIIVLGGGLAGLTSAYELQSLGHTVTVLEAQSRPGGRVRTLREPFAPGLYTEAGAESIPGAHDLTQHTLGAPEGRIHFAGEHTSPWTGWMQGAFESARRAVKEINGV